MQKTLKSDVVFIGTGLHTGTEVKVCVRPASAETGIWFRRTDVPAGKEFICANWQFSVRTELCTRLENEDGVSVSTVEHVMAALAGCGINNAIIELNGPELPIMDGSALEFVSGFLRVGFVNQIAPVRALEILEKVEVNEEQIGPFLDDIYEKLASFDRENLIKHFVSAEFNRYLSYYKNSRDINISGGKNKRDSREPRDRKSRSERRESKFATIYINVGARNNLSPNRLMGLINEALDSKDAVIGSIDIMKKFSFFEIEENRKTEIINALNKESFEDVSLSVEISKEMPNKASSTKDDYFKGKRKNKFGRDNKFRSKKGRKNKGSKGKWKKG